MVTELNSQGNHREWGQKPGFHHRRHLNETCKKHAIRKILWQEGEIRKYTFLTLWGLADIGQEAENVKIKNEQQKTRQHFFWTKTSAKGNWATEHRQHVKSIWVTLNLQARQSRTLKKHWLHPKQPEGRTTVTGKKQMLLSEDELTMSYEESSCFPGGLVVWKNLKLFQSPGKALLVTTESLCYAHWGRVPSAARAPSGSAALLAAKLQELQTEQSASNK